MAKKNKKSIFRTLITITLLLVINALISYLVYYGLKTNRLFGLKGYLDFSLPRCHEPLFFKSNDKRTTDNDIATGWKLYKNENQGYSLKVPSDWEIAKDWECTPEYRDGCFRSKDKNLQISVLAVERNFDFKGEFLNWPLYYPDSKLTQPFSCEFPTINDYKAIERFIGRPKFDNYFLQTLIDTGEKIYIFNQELKTNDQAAKKILQNITSTFRHLTTPEVQTPVEPYNGIPSPQVPYKGLSFTEIDAYSTKDLTAEFSESDYHYQGMPIDGYTFIAYKDDFLDFRVLWPSDGKVQRNLAPIYTELYAYGPTVIAKEGVFDFEVPQTGRYFLVIKAKPDWKYKGYRLQIEKKP